MKSDFTSLLILDAHQRMLHEGTQLTLATIHRECRIHKGPAVVK